MSDSKRTWSGALPHGLRYSFSATWKEGGSSLEPALVDLLWLLDGSGVVVFLCDPSAYLVSGPWRVEPEGGGLAVIGFDPTSWTYRPGESYHFPEPAFAADFLMSCPECYEVVDAKGFEEDW